ncbi:hypothetical protein ACFPYI_18145 [Halomarina salina]|uniref:Uncharacterized protein n=1 Tax=Halomarina salina TaxID=1872699 RepID=A0ABD5RRM4_9EURY|nr:hypothetical protein [Halomarina salina]
MDSARPVGGRPGTQLLATGETKPFTGVVRTSVTLWTRIRNAVGIATPGESQADGAVVDDATARLRPRYREDVLHSATGEAASA